MTKFKDGKKDPVSRVSRPWRPNGYEQIHTGNTLEML